MSLLVEIGKLLRDFFSPHPEVAGEQPATAEPAPVEPAVPREARAEALPPRRQINQAGLSLIKQFEGLRLTAYRDAVGVWTVGFGHTKHAHAGQVIDEATAEAYLREDLAFAEGAVAGFSLKLTDNRFAALVSFTFNLGVADLRQLLSHGIEQVPVQMLRWDYDREGGKMVKVPGLSRRRQAEAELWRRV